MSEISKIDIEDIHNIKVNKRINAYNITLFPNGEKAFVWLSSTSSSFHILDIVHSKLIKPSYEGNNIAFVDQDKLIIAINYEDSLSVIDLEKQEVLKKIKLPSNVWRYEEDSIKIIQDKNFALILLQKGALIIFDIKKQKFIGNPIKFINSEKNDIENFEIRIVPEEKKETKEFFNFENFDLNINYEKKIVLKINATLL
jgi:hypothetical protein